VNAPLSAQGRLQGCTVVVTRPAAQTARLAALLTAEGAAVLVLPVMDIVPATAAVLAAAEAAVLAADWAVWVSPAAIDLLAPCLPQPLPAAVRFATVGAASARRLHTATGHAVLHPVGQSDGEALLALPELADLAGQRVVVLKGEGGRADALADTLRARGATVSVWNLYRRQPAKPDWTAWDALPPHRPLAGVVTSSEAADWLFQLAGESRQARLQSAVYAVPHPRIAQRLAHHGASQCLMTPADDVSLVSALCLWFSNAHDR
jgi:uroporphyrinogen-III synthase